IPIVRQVGREDAGTISRARAWAYVAHFQAMQRCHVDAAQIDTIRAHAEQTFAAHPGDPMSLLALPRHAGDVARIRPLLRSVAYHDYPIAWRGTDPLGDPETDL